MIDIEAVPGHALAEVDLAHRVHQVLAKHYPGYEWAIGIDEEGGVMNIMSMTVNHQILGTPNWGYVLKLSRVYADPGLACVMRAGGAILESANINRGWNKNETIRHIDGVKGPLVTP